MHILPLLTLLTGTVHETSIQMKGSPNRKVSEGVFLPGVDVNGVVCGSMLRLRAGILGDLGAARGLLESRHSAVCQLHALRVSAVPQHSDALLHVAACVNHPRVQRCQLELRKQAASPALSKQQPVLTQSCSSASL